MDRQFTEERDATEDCFSRVLLPVSVHAQQPAVPRMSYFNGALKAAGGNPQTVRYVTATCGSRVPDLQDLMPFSATEATPTRGRHTVQEAQRLPRLEVWARLRMARWYVYRRLWRGGQRRNRCILWQQWVRRRSKWQRGNRARHFECAAQRVQNRPSAGSGK